MNRLLKWILAGVGTVVILLVIVAVVLPMVIDPNNYKDEMRAAALDKTGRELTIGGEIQWTVFPSIGLVFSNLILSNRVGFGDRPMLDIVEARASVRVMPLFRREIEVGEVKLTGVTAYLRRNADGQNNWEDLFNTQLPTTTASGSDPLADSEIEISGGNITLRKTDQAVGMVGFGTNPTGTQANQSFDLAGDFSVNLPQQQLTGEVKFDGLVQAMVNEKLIGIEDLVFSFNGKQGSAPEPVSLDLTANTDVVVDIKNDKATFSDLSLRFFDIQANGSIDVTSLSSVPRFAGQLKLADFSPKSFIRALGMEAPKTKDASALTSMQADMGFVGSSENFNIQDLSVKLDKSVFKGNLKIENADQLRLAYDFEVDALNLDEYSVDPPAQAGTQNEVESKDPSLAFGVLFALPGGGDFRIGKLVAGGLTATDVSLTSRSDANGIRLFPINARFYGGQHQGDIKIDISGGRPILTATQTLTGVQAEGLLQDLTGSPRLRGTGDFYLEIRTDLSSSQSARQALSGDVGMSILDGAIAGLNVAGTVRAAQAALGKQTATSGAAGQNPRTDFSEFAVTGIIKQGILKSDDLMLLSPLLRVSGKGTINLVDETINYLIKPVLVGSLEGQGVDALRGVPIPVRLTGNLYEPDIAVDPIAAISGSTKVLLDANKDDLAKTLLDGLFGSNKDKKNKTKKKADGG